MCISPGTHTVSASRPHCTSPDDLHCVQDLYGRGVDIGPSRFLGMRGGGERKYSFGVYGRSGFTQAMMQDKWAGKPASAIFACACIVARTSAFLLGPMPSLEGQDRLTLSL